MRLLALLLTATMATTALALGPVPDEPVEIGHEPQYFFDDWIVDNRWALRQNKDELVRVVHQPVKHPANPVIPDHAGYVTVQYDERDKLFRMWYQDHWTIDPAKNKTRYGIGYAESDDGVNWRRPKLGLHAWRDGDDSNMVWRGLQGTGSVSAGGVLDLPEQHRRGHRFVMLYKDFYGLHLIGSDDGIHWDPDSDLIIGDVVRPDTQNCIVHDPKRERFLLYTRDKARYIGNGSLDGGASRRIAVTANDELWTRWPLPPNRSNKTTLQTVEPDTLTGSMGYAYKRHILIPDARDAQDKFNYFYGMPTRYHEGLFYGMLWPFRHNNTIYTELVTSRDGVNFTRLPNRPRLIPLGEEGQWDDGMIFVSPQWVEHGDEWWLYYAAHDGPHESKQRTAGVGLATIRKGGFVSLRGPDKRGGVVVTRVIRWPGGALHVNADATDGELTVRVSNPLRHAVIGYDHDDTRTFTGDSVDHRVTFAGGSMDAMTGKLIRLEFFLRNADLFSFQAKESP